MDSDDVLYPNYLEEYCNFLEQNHEFGFCYAKIKFVAEDTLKPLHVMGRTIHPGEPDNFFEDLLVLHNKPAFPFCMARSKALLTVLPERKIYESPGGQNLQILLPLAYTYRCGYIDKILALRVERPDSHSHGSFRNRFANFKYVEDIVLNTLKNIEMPNEERLRCGKKASNFYKWKRRQLLLEMESRLQQAAL